MTNAYHWEDSNTVATKGFYWRSKTYCVIHYSGIHEPLLQHADTCMTARRSCCHAEGRGLAEKMSHLELHRSSTSSNSCSWEGTTTGTNICWWPTGKLVNWWLESRWAGKDLVLVGIKMNMNQQYAFAAKKAESVLGCTWRCDDSRMRWSFPAAQHYWGAS